jgi:hypothetical protein
VILIKIHFQDEVAFQEACSNGDKSICEWLYSLGHIKQFPLWLYESNIFLRFSLKEIFQMICYFGYFSPAKRLYETI